MLAAANNLTWSSSLNQRNECVWRALRFVNVHIETPYTKRLAVSASVNRIDAEMLLSRRSPQSSLQANCENHRAKKAIGIHHGPSMRWYVPILFCRIIAIEDQLVVLGSSKWIQVDDLRHKWFLIPQSVKSPYLKSDFKFVVANL